MWASTSASAFSPPKTSARETSGTGSWRIRKSGGEWTWRASIPNRSGQHRATRRARGRPRPGAPVSEDCGDRKGELARFQEIVVRALHGAGRRVLVEPREHKSLVVREVVHVQLVPHVEPVPRQVVVGLVFHEGDVGRVGGREERTPRRGLLLAERRG